MIAAVQDNTINNALLSYKRFSETHNDNLRFGRPVNTTHFKEVEIYEFLNKYNFSGLDFEQANNVKEYYVNALCSLSNCKN